LIFVTPAAAGTPSAAGAALGIKRNSEGAAMKTFVMMTHLSPEAVPKPSILEEFEKRAMAHIHRECPSVRWLHSWAVLGAYDYVDVFDAPDIETAMKVSTIFRTFGRVRSQILPAVEWTEFKALLHSLPEH
jgi:uncharacterized protein with GYD domain